MAVVFMFVHASPNKGQTKAPPTYSRHKSEMNIIRRASQVLARAPILPKSARNPVAPMTFPIVKATARRMLNAVGISHVEVMKLHREGCTKAVRDSKSEGQYKK